MDESSGFLITIILKTCVFQDGNARIYDMGFALQYSLLYSFRSGVYHLWTRPVDDRIISFNLVSGLIALWHISTERLLVPRYVAK